MGDVGSRERPQGETQMTSTTTKTFALYSLTTGHSFGEWEATSADDAMDQMEAQAGQELDRSDIECREVSVAA